MANKTQVNKSSFPEIIEIYNKSGNSAAQRYIRENYGIINSSYVIKRIKKSSDFEYDTENDVFRMTKSNNESELFMNLDELCESRTSKMIQPQIDIDSKKDAMESLIKELISDRLLELSKYIVIDATNRTIMIDISTMKTDGYQIVTH